MIRRLASTLLFISTMLAQAATNTETPTLGSVIFANDYMLKIEIADTQTLRAKGLMHRIQLAENEGMLFVYPTQTLLGVWMKNTLLELDVFFITEDGKISSIIRNLKPCYQEPCPIYNSITPALYMLEVNAGFADRHQVAIGQEIMIGYNHNAN